MKPGTKETPYDQIAAEYDDLFDNHNLYYESVNRCEMELFKDWVQKPNSPQLALDVGCGTGFHTKWLVDCGFNTIGMDQSEAMIQIAETKSHAWHKQSEFRVMEVNELDQMPEDAYAVVLCLGSVLNHLKDWKAFANLVSKRLSNGGLFLFSYDNIDGIDVIARTLLRQFSGYSDAYVREILLGRIKARIGGRSFNNHWRVHTNRAQVEVPLKYEHTRRWRAFLEESGLHLCELRGTHVLDCFDRSMLQASAGIIPIQKESGLLKRCLKKVDRVLARHLYCISANVVGIAVKDSRR